LLQYQGSLFQNHRPDTHDNGDNSTINATVDSYQVSLCQKSLAGDSCTVSTANASCQNPIA